MSLKQFYTTEADKFGRFVLPKQVRMALGIGPGTHLKISLQGRSLMIEKEELKNSSVLVRKKGLLVIGGEGQPVTNDEVKVLQHTDV